MIKENIKDTPPKPRSTTRGKLIVLLFVVLMVSSGTLYYRDSPMNYYAFLGLSVLLIIIIVYLMIYIGKGQPELFSDRAKGKGVRGFETTENEGLETVLKAEKRYKERLKMTRGKSTKGSPKELATNTPSKIKGKGAGRSKRIGSIPLEESIFTEKVSLKNKSTKEMKSKKSNKVTTFLCPSCGSKELYYEAGLISGYKYHCKDCDYIGSFVIEKDFKVNGSK